MEGGLPGVKSDRGFIRIVTGAGRQVNFAGAAACNVSVDQQRLCREEIRQMLRINVCHLDALKRKLHVSEHGTFNAFEEVRHLAADFVVVRDVGECSAAELRHLGRQKKIGLAADGNRVEPRVAEIAVKRGKDFFFVAKITISKKNDVANV